MAQQGRTSLNALTGARFLAAYWVVVYHFVTYFRTLPLPGKAPSPGHIPSLMYTVINEGHLAVDFFFLLSGFILAYTYVTPEGKMRGTRREFWVARIARIYPVYILGLLIYLPVYLTIVPGWGVFALSVVAHIFMLHSWIPVTIPWNGPSWSLGVEAFFYALFPLLLPLAGRLRRKGLWLLLIGSWLFLAVMDAVLVFAAKLGMEKLQYFRDVVRYNPVPSFPMFITGMALGLLFIRYGRDALPLLRKANGPVFDALIIVALIVSAGLLVFSHKLGIHGASVDTMGPIMLLPMAAIILLLAFQRGVIAWLLSHPFAVWLGEISYAVYILHNPLWFVLSHPLWAVLKAVFLTLTHHAPDDVAMFVAFSLTVVASAGLSFQFIERPLRRAIRQRWGQPEKMPVFPNMLLQASTVARRDQGA